MLSIFIIRGCAVGLGGADDLVKVADLHLNIGLSRDTGILAQGVDPGALVPDFSGDAVGLVKERDEEALGRGLGLLKVEPPDLPLARFAPWA